VSTVAHTVGHGAPVMEKPSRTLLVVDDEPTIVFAITRFFKARGFTVDGVTDKASAVDRLGRACPDVAIIDLRLGGQGDTQGFEVLDLTRARCPKTRAVLLTAYGSKQLDAEASRRGFDLVVPKPTPLAGLAEAVEGLLERQPRSGDDRCE
jgi:CheY-like chemotaxis protein